MAVTAESASSIDLYWIPLGAGGRSVRFNGIVYETLAAGLQRRPRQDIYHSALELKMPDGVYTVEMTPVPDDRGWERGVVAQGPVGVGWAGRLRIFRYEVRRWRDGVIPDLRYAVSPPVHLTDEAGDVERVFELLPHVPTLTWGRDERHAGDMWSCNSIISWALARARLDPVAIPLPLGGRAPGWDAGITIARGMEADRRQAELGGVTAAAQKPSGRTPSRAQPRQRRAR